MHIYSENVLIILQNHYYHHSNKLDTQNTLVKMHEETKNRK